MKETEENKVKKTPSKRTAKSKSSASKKVVEKTEKKKETAKKVGRPSTKKVTEKSVTPKKKTAPKEKKIIAEKNEEIIIAPMDENRIEPEVIETQLEATAVIKAEDTERSEISLELKKRVEPTKLEPTPKESKKRINTFRTSEVVTLVIVTCIVSILMGTLITYSLLREENQYHSEQFSDEMKEFIDNYHYIKENYGDKVTEKDLLNGAINGLLDAVGDPYAGFIDQNSRLNQELAGSLYGVGLEIINNKEGNIEIYNVFENSPAGRAGLEKGDILNSINGLDLTNQSTSVFSTYVQGNVTDEFKIEYTRGEEQKEVTLKKEYVVIPSVFSNIFEKNGKKVGYLQVTVFSATTYNQFKTALEKLENEGIDRLVIDVRNNSGGRLDAVSDMLSLFLDSSHVIYQTDTNGKKEKYYSTGKSTKKYPVAVLVNGLSASASEILASTLNEEYEAMIIGTTTYGKGTVQQIKTLQNGDEYKVTTKKWLTPSGKWIDEQGVQPTTIVELEDNYYENPTTETDNQLQTALDLITK